MSGPHPWRREDGSIVWCHHVGPYVNGRGFPVECARVIGHAGDHENGTYRWRAS